MTTSYPDPHSDSWQPDDTEPGAEYRRDPRPQQKTAEEDLNLPEFLAHPTKVDIFLLIMLFAMAVWGIALIPFRAWLLTEPVAYTFLVGGYTSSVIGGAHASVGEGPWWMYWLFTLVGALKFVPFYYWMGKRWGMDFIDMSVKYTPWLKKMAHRAMTSTKAKGITGALVPLCYTPGPVPSNIINALLGLLRVSAGLMIVLNAVSVLAINGLFIWLGYTFGDQVLAVVEVVNRYLLWITLALIVVAIFHARRTMKRNAALNADTNQDEPGKANAQDRNV
ncbi:hypothetical protein QDX23_09980 [Auritidibacter ignavus]|uniref:DedA family protein n=1 Tax=Auritidibacter ignavus TaxID=678932 RepID=UPI002449CC98|nr:hypothetical protein [Auritidibacter ignavus]WGH90435.1 hypothetical protein QDX23_09980 [Auritidibacter ignavus]